MFAADIRTCADRSAIRPCTIISDLDASEKIRQSSNEAVPALSYSYDMDERAPNHLRAWRKFRHMTQQDLADALGTAKSVVSDLERGVVQLNDKWLRRLAPVLGTQPGILLDHAPEDLDSDILDIFTHIPAENRAQAVAVLRTFLPNGTDG